MTRTNAGVRRAFAPLRDRLAAGCRAATLAVAGALSAGRPADATPVASVSAAPAHPRESAPKPVLPSVGRALALPYPAYGTPQPQIIESRTQAGIPSAISLEQATAVAIDRVPLLAQARADVALEDASVQLERTASQPLLAIAGTTTQSYTQGLTDAKAALGESTGTPVSGVGQSNVAEVSLQQLVYDGGRIRARIEAAKLTRDAALAAYRREAQNVAIAVAQAYYTVLRDERLVAVDEQLLEQDVVSENLVRAQIAAGTIAGAELATQLAVTANARTSLVTAQGNLQSDRVAFATTLGLDADSDVLPSDDTQGLETTTPSSALPPFSGALDVAYAERPDLDEARLQSRSSEASLLAAERGRIPTLSFAAGKGLGSTDPGGGAYLNTGSIGFDVSIPVYDRGLTRANIASSRASIAIAKANQANVRLSIQQEVRQALIAIVSDRATLDQTRAAFESADSALRSTQGRFRVGVSTSPALIQAQAELASASTDIVSAIYALQLAQINLRYSLGTILQ